MNLETFWNKTCFLTSNIKKWEYMGTKSLSAKALLANVSLNLYL